MDVTGFFIALVGGLAIHCGTLARSIPPLWTGRVIVLLGYALIIIGFAAGHHH